MAALIAACDQVVSIINVTLHLAGAIGIDSKILVSRNNLFYLGHNDTNSFWYPSLKLFRQTQSGEWGKELNRIKNEICPRKMPNQN